MKKRVFYQSLVKSLYLCLILLLLFLSCASSQRIEHSVAAMNSYPQFPGGEEGFRQFIVDNISYPSEALEKNEMAAMLVICQVGTDGVLKDITILNSWNENVRETILAEEVRKVLSNIPAFIPATGKYASETFFVIPFHFVICKEEDLDEMPRYIVEPAPRFPSGEEDFYRYIKSKMKYSWVDCLRNKPGKVKVGFIMGQDGTIKESEVIEAYSPKCDKMILDILDDMPKWIPGNARSSRPVLFHMTISFTANKKLFKPEEHIQFQLEDFALLSQHQSRFWLKENLLDLVKRGKVITCMPVSLTEIE